MRLIYSTLIVLFLFGCGKEAETPSTQVNVNALSNCGVIQYDPTSTEFIFSCGLSGRNVDMIKDMSEITLQKVKECDIYYNDKGQPEKFFCRDKAESIDKSGIEGNWMCTGLDGYGGYHSKHKSALVLNANGTYDLHLFAKKDSDSVWHVADSVMAGSYSVNKNKLVLAPKTWTGELIDKAGLSFDKAPKFMLVKPFSIEVKNQSEILFDGTLRREDKANEILSYVDCEKFNFK